jgi:hypothetical protein
MPEAGEDVQPDQPFVELHRLRAQARPFPKPGDREDPLGRRHRPAGVRVHSWARSPPDSAPPARPPNRGGASDAPPGA